jgi:SAM-dependent methyltransferase
MKNTSKEPVRIEKCPICDSGNIVKHLEITHQQQHFSTDRCHTCGFIFMNPRFDDTANKNLYDEGYYTGKNSFSYIDERQSFEYSKYVWDARLRKIRSYVKKGNFLDVGCSFGGFLSRASKFFTPFGIEISSYSATYAQEKYRFKIHTGTIDNSPFKSGSFSVISMIELIEHLPDPAKAVEKCYDLLKDGGLLVIQTADMDGWQAIKAGGSYHYYLPGHLSYFTQHSLTRLLQNCGFSKIKIYRPVDFGLMPKLLKSRGSFTSVKEYKKWIGIICYHVKGFISYRNHPMTSSMVIYAVK